MKFYEILNNEKQPFCAVGGAPIFNTNATLNTKENAILKYTIPVMYMTLDNEHHHSIRHLVTFAN